MDLSESLVTPPERLRARRDAAFQALDGGALVLAAAPVQYRSRDGERPYHPDRDLFYLTGTTEPQTVAVLSGAGEPRFTLFVRDRDPEAELWSGPRLGRDGAMERFRPDECHPIGELDECLPRLLQGADRIYFRLGRRDTLEEHVVRALSWARGRGARTGTGPRAVEDPGEILDDLRVVKDDWELGLLRRAAAVSVEGQRAGASAARPGAGEWVVAAEVDRAFSAAGARGPAYETIAGSGVNACTLHYTDNSKTVAEGDLVLVDAGAEHGLYAGDITRTWPASGRFTPEQRDVYEVVDAARRAAIEVVRPGATIADVHVAATRVIVEGLVALGVLKGSVEEVLENQEHKPYFPHQTSHWLGLDVHDPGDYARGGVPRTLEPGMVFTVEPGLYFRPGQDGGPERLAGIGVRIEDDVVVTAEGCEVLTAALPAAVDEVEALVEGTR